MKYIASHSAPSLAGYVRASTDNPTGWRPNVTRLGDLHRGKRHGFRNRLGDDPFSSDPNGGDPYANSGNVPSEDDLRNQLSAITNRLKQANAQLVAQEQEVRAAGFGAYSAQVGQNLLSLRNEFESILAKYTTVYRAMFGTTPAGLSSLGIDPVTAAWVAVALTALVAALVLLNQHLNNNAQQLANEKAVIQNNGVRLQQAAALNQQATDAEARGDTATAQSLRTEAARLRDQAKDPSSTDWSKFLQNNWGWLAAAVGGVVLASKI